MSKTREYHRACSSGELPEHAMKAVVVAGEAVLLARVEGIVYAVENLCPHEEIALYKGCLRGDRIECSLHGAQFRLRDGQVCQGPALQNIRCFAVRESDGEISVAVS
ncbi:non-heme iron oxygenase ferredoxin subunit [Granulosicoccaceae sp. 1_MG-2023]|nr:non-heme iron oxygenase ferredoxin subunit [Granulosicoccaceae sp. 1_MG-2023]